jgi:uroporphyrin-3 C-methyltransferase
MSEPQSAPPPSPTAPARDPAAEGARQRRRRRRLLLVLAVAAAIAIAAVWADGFRRTQALQLQLAQRLAEADQVNRDSKSLAQQAQESAREAQAKIALLEARLAESQTQQAALESLYRELTPSRDDIVLTEIEQMLLLASQQLQLAGNVQNALVALQAADAQLQRLNRPQFTNLRRGLARDMDRLKAQPFVDVTGMSLRLDQLLAGVEKLPMSLDERLPAPAGNNGKPVEGNLWDRVVRDFWVRVADLVRIEKLQQPEPPLLPPTQQYFVRENVRLRLLTARQALLARDDASFHSDLRAVEEWLKRYFDARAKSTQIALTTVKQLQATVLSGETPDLAASLDAIRILRLARERSNR